MSTAPTTAREAVAALGSFPDLSSAGISFTAVTTANGKFAGLHVPLTDAAKLDIAAIAQDTRRKLEDATLIPYGPATLIPRQHWMHVPVDGAADLAQIESVVARQDALPFNSKSRDARSVRMLAARFTVKDGRTVTLYRVADALMQLKKANVLGLILDGGVYNRVEPADILLMRTEFDVIVIDGFAFFSKKSTFERAFGFLSELRAASAATFDAVTAGLRIEGGDAFKAACTSQIQMMSKMSSIKRSMDDDPDYATAMTTTNLIAYIEAHPDVDVEIIGDGADRRLVFDPAPARRFQILKLLDDDFLYSVLTERSYEAGSKHQTGTI